MPRPTPPFHFLSIAFSNSFCLAAVARASRKSTACPTRCCELLAPPTFSLVAGSRYQELMTNLPYSSVKASSFLASFFAFRLCSRLFGFRFGSPLVTSLTVKCLLIRLFGSFQSIKDSLQYRVAEVLLLLLNLSDPFAEVLHVFLGLL